MKYFAALSALYLSVFIVGCGIRQAKFPTEDAVQSDELPQIYPDYVGVTVPLDIAPLDFAMLSDSVSAIDVEVKGSRGGSLHTNGESAEFDIDE